MKIKIKYDSVFSVPEAAIILGVCEATVRKRIHLKGLRLAHSMNNQGAYLITGSSLREELKGNPRYTYVDDSFDIPEERRVEYLLAAKDRCMRELRAAEAAMVSNTVQLNEILHELFKEEGS